VGAEIIGYFPTHFYIILQNLDYAENHANKNLDLCKEIIWQKQMWYARTLLASRAF